jgi:hypothetical protein
MENIFPRCVGLDVHKELVESLCAAKRTDRRSLPHPDRHSCWSAPKASPIEPASIAPPALARAELAPESAIHYRTPCRSTALLNSRSRPAAADENISCESPPFLLSPVPLDENRFAQINTDHV